MTDQTENPDIYILFLINDIFPEIIKKIVNRKNARFFDRGGFTRTFGGDAFPDAFKVKAFFIITENQRFVKGF